jgi:excisionase family DNA binding protein
MCSSHSAEAPNVSWFMHADSGARSLSPAPTGGIFLQYFRISDLESQLGISKSTIYRLIKDGEFDTVKIGHSVRVTEQSLDAYISSHTTFGTAVSR